MKVAFLVNDLSLSGGVNVIVNHASVLQKKYGHDVYIVTIFDSVGMWAQEKLSGVKVVLFEELSDMFFDLVIATFWETQFHMTKLNAHRYAWFCQSLEDRFYPEGSELRYISTAAMSLPIPVITEANWIVEALTSHNPNREVSLVLNGVDKNYFFNEQVQQRETSKLRILLEGPLGSVTKGTELALAGALGCKTPVSISHITHADTPIIDSRYTIVKAPLSFEEMAKQYSSHDVIVKTSRVEGMFGPPLEAFHCGSTAIVTPVTGHEEYIKDGINSLVTPWDNPNKLSELLDRLNTDRDLLSRLKQSALDTAANWPSWEQSTANFNLVIEKIVANPSRLGRDDYKSMLWAVRSLRLPLAQKDSAIRALGALKPEKRGTTYAVSRIIQADLVYWLRRFITKPIGTITLARETFSEYK